MSFVKISELPAAASAAATDQIETNQGGTSRRLTVGQIAAHVAGNLTDTTITGTAVISANSATDAFRITQTGTGNAFVVEDAANPDSTPFVVNTNGQVIQGYTADITSASFQANGANTFSGVRWNSGTQTGTAIILGRSRSATIGTNAIVLTGDNLGAINFSGDDGAAFIRAASISADVDLTPGTNDMPGRLVFSTTADGAAAPTERMRITSTGNIAIGSPTGGVVARLDVIGPSNLSSIRTLTTDSVGDQNFEANLIDYNVSGTDALTTSKNHNGLRVDVDSNASGGTTVNEHILRGVYATVDVVAAGVSQSVYGVQGVIRTQNTTGTVNDMYGAFNAANIDPGVGGTVSTAFGSINLAYAGGAGTISTIYGSRNEAVVEIGATAGVTNAYGTFNEIEIDGNTLTNAYATYSVVNSDGGVTTNGYLYRGEYQISAPGTVTNAWGLYLTGSTKNYVAGQIQADAGTAAAPTFSQFTDTNTGIFFPSADTIAFAEGGAESMRIDASGNVGIGTTTPAANSLSIARGAGVGASVEIAANGATPGGSNSFSLVSGSSNEVSIYNRANASMIVGTNNAERMRITSAGNVGIGTSAPTALLDINSNTLRLRTAKTPASATDTGNAGDIAWDADYIYVCTATNTWKRTALSTW